MENFVWKEGKSCLNACLSCLVSSLLCAPMSQNFKKLVHIMQQLHFLYFATKWITIAGEEKLQRPVALCTNIYVEYLHLILTILFLAFELPLLWTLLQKSLALGAACCLPLLLNLLLFFYASMQANSTVILLQIFAQWTQKQNPCSCTQGTENFSVWKVTGWRLLLCRLKFRFSLLVHLTSLWKQFTLGACYLNW